MAGQILASGSTLAISDASTTVNTNAVQTISFAPTTASSGNFAIAYGGGLGSVAATSPLVSATIPFSGTAAQVATALIALANIGNNVSNLPNVATSGGPFPGTPVVVTFQNDLAAQAVPLLTFPASLNTLSPATVISAAMTTAGSKAGGVYAAFSRLATLAFPNTKADVKETTNFDSAANTKEYIQGYIAPGDVAIEGQWIGDATQDWRTGMIAKFFGHQTWGFRTNVPNKLPGTGVFTPGTAIFYQGFFTDGSVQAAKHDDVVMVRGSIQISGQPIYAEPVQ